MQLNVSCPICTNLFSPHTEHIYTTHCGHLFHFACLIDWLEISQTCPQCRNPTTKDSIFRIYFNISNTNLVDEFKNIKTRLIKVRTKLRKEIGKLKENTIVENEIPFTKTTIDNMAFRFTLLFICVALLISFEGINEII